MKRIQGSPVGKLLSWALLLVFTFAGVQMGLSAAYSAILAVGDWQSTSAFSALLQERRDQLAQCRVHCLPVPASHLRRQCFSV